MLLSVITINYNNGSGLRKTISSVIHQSFQDFEYIIVDGASSDDSVEVIESLIKDKESRNCKWISEPDEGIYNAMNKGIRLSKGEYLLFLNSGDFLVADDVLEKVFRYECHADLLCARCRVSEEGKVVWTSALVPSAITLRWLYFKGLMHQSTFIRRDLFSRVGMYDESFRWLADVQFWYKALLYNDATSQPINVITTDYNHEGTSSTTKHNSDFSSEIHWPDTQPVLRHIMPDYKIWKRDKRIALEYGWIDKHRFLKSALRSIRKLLERRGGQ